MKLSLSAILAVCAFGFHPVNAQTKPHLIDFKLGTKSGDPLANLPENIESLTSFGERPAFSPDGSKIAFIGASYGDAFEYDIATRTTRNLTAHTPHGGFLRIHYLPDGNMILLGPRGMGKSRDDTRHGLVEIWFLAKGEGSVIVPLGQFAFEGIAVSKVANRIVWSRKQGELGKDPAGYTALMTGEIVSDGKRAKIEKVREIVRKPFSECVLEPQDFRKSDTEITASCYGGSIDANGKTQVISGVWGVRLADGAMTRYYLDNRYNEVEGISADGSWTTVECGPGYGMGLDICRLDLNKPGNSLQRITHFLDYGQTHRVSNPVISWDGKLMAFQYGRAEDEAGVGRGLLLMRMQNRN